MEMTIPINTLTRLLLLFCILKVVADTYVTTDLPETPSEDDYSNYIDILKRSSKTVRRALNEGVKSKILTPITFIDEHVAMTNTLRSKHSSPPLEIDYQLCLDAEAHAKGLAQQSRTANTIIVKRSGAKNVGESVLGGQNIAKVTGAFSAEYWYSEINYHNWNDNIFNSKTGHFTQMIWKATTNMGVAQVSLPSDGTNINVTIVVAKYFPQGNWLYKSSFAANVIKPP